MFSKSRFGVWMVASIAVVVCVAAGALPAHATVIQVDNSDAGFATGGTGAWSSSVSTSPWIGSNYLHSNQSATLTATWTANLPSAGDWDVWGHWSQATNRGRFVPYTVSDTGGPAVVERDQTLQGGWSYLGRFEFGAGSNTVGISTANDSGRYVIADAIKFTTPDETSFRNIIDPADLVATASTTISSGNRVAANAVNGAGIEGRDSNSDWIGDKHLATTHGGDNNWMSNVLTSELVDGSLAGDGVWFKVDLGRSHLLDEIEVWNFNATGLDTDRGVSMANVFYSNLDTDPGSDFTDPSKWTLFAAAQSFGEATGNNLYGLDDTTTLAMNRLKARWIALEITDNHGDAGFAGLGELQFFGDPVPEPSTLALACLGLLGLVSWGRRRKR